MKKTTTAYLISGTLGVAMLALGLFTWKNARYTETTTATVLSSSGCGYTLRMNGQDVQKCTAFVKYVVRGKQYTGYVSPNDAQHRKWSPGTTLTILYDSREPEKNLRPLQTVSDKTASFIMFGIGAICISIAIFRPTLQSV